LEPGCLDHFLDFVARECGPHRGFDVLSHTAAESRRTFRDSTVHFESPRSFKVTNQQGALRLQHSVDFGKDRSGIIKDVQRRVRNDQIEICRLEAHSPCVADLKESPLTETPCCTRL